MGEFSSRVESMSESGIGEAVERAGEDAINLGPGQPDFPTMPEATEAAIEAIKSGEAHNYTDSPGIRPLREAIRDKHERDNGFRPSLDGVICTAGAAEALHIALEAHVDPGDKVLHPAPGFVSYDALTRVAGGTPVPLPLRDDLTLDPATVADSITDDTAAVVVNSPANPTGAVYPPEDMRELARIADEHDIVLISDEVYERFVFDGEHRSPMEFAETDSVVVVNGASKTYSMTGWRLGWTIASERRTKRMFRVHQYSQVCASAPAQYAARAALEAPQDWVDNMVATFERRRNVLLDGLADMGLEVPTPKGAFYAMVDVPEGWVEEVLDRGVVVVPGEAFGNGGEGYARISYATDTDTIEAGLDIMAEATRAVR
ncbi:pyridoxal phosphate-dependent aminotransferase [Haloplanus salilacus]|uniref:pyridoxal phosphate-dependent aminotransferase n=1 Tax=Haloplanus salilacus TaxID=2949994 RepID=UPI0030CDE484